MAARPNSRNSLMSMFAMFDVPVLTVPLERHSQQKNALYTARRIVHVAHTTLDTVRTAQEHLPKIALSRSRSSCRFFTRFRCLHWIVPYRRLRIFGKRQGLFMASSYPSCQAQCNGVGAKRGGLPTGWRHQSVVQQIPPPAPYRSINIGKQQ